MFKKIAGLFSVKKVVLWLSGFLYRKLVKEIDKLDRLEPAIVTLINENVKPEEIAVSVVDYVQKFLVEFIKKIFGR